MGVRSGQPSSSAALFCFVGARPVPVAALRATRSALDWGDQPAQFCAVKTITRDKAGRKFQAVADLAHSGETVVVTHAGQRWCRIVPPNGKPRKSAADFEARLAKLFPRPLAARAMADFIQSR